MINSSAKVSVVIVNWNKRDYVKSCLYSLGNQAHKPDEVIVVDNASSDGSTQMIEKEFPHVVIIENQKNHYFATAFNRGITYAKSEFVLCLNNDVILDKFFLEEIIKQTNIDVMIGIWGGKVLRMDRVTIDTTGQFLSRNRRPLERGYEDRDHGQFDKEGYIFGVGGAAAFFRKAMLEEIKVNNEYFDEDFKLFYEDLDLNWRANRFGWKAYYVPEAVAYHIRGGTTKTKKPRFFSRFYFTHLPVEAQSLVIQNRYLTIIKNDSFKKYIKDCFFILSYDFAMLSYICLLRPTLFKNLKNFLTLWKIALKKRKLISDKISA